MMNNNGKRKEERKRKWLVKQDCKRQKIKADEHQAQEQQEWIRQHASFVTVVTADHVQRFGNGRNSRNDHDQQQRQTEPTLPSTLNDDDDAAGDQSWRRLLLLLEPYWKIQDRKPKHLCDSLTTTILNQQQQESLRPRMFIAEGAETIRLLIQESVRQKEERSGLHTIQLQSIFLKPTLFFDAPVQIQEEIQKVMQTKSNNTNENTVNSSDETHPGFHVLLASETIMSKMAGYPVTRGILACGMVPQDRTEGWLDQYIDNQMTQKQQEGRNTVHRPLRLLAMDGVCDTANLGSMIRCASAFAIDAIILSKNTCDCWYRKCIRVSMGHVFRVPIVRVTDLAATLHQWNQRYRDGKMRTFAAVVDDADCVLHQVESMSSSAWCCVMGNEGNGISDAVLKACHSRIRIDMEEGVDSLSVPMACGILLHGLREREASRG